MLTKQQREDIFEFLDKCKDENKQLIEILTVLKTSLKVDIAEAIDIISEHKKIRSEGKGE